MLSHLKWVAIPSLSLAAVVLVRALTLGTPVAPVPGDSELALAQIRLDLARAGEFALVVSPGELEILHGAVLMRRARLTGASGLGSGVKVHTVVSRRGTLPFEPIQRVLAPESPDELVASPTVKPLDADPAYGVLVFEGGGELRLLPDDLTSAERLRVTGYRSMHHLRRVASVTRRLVAGDSTGIAPVMTIRTSDADARAVFRAMPIGAVVVVRGD